MSDIRWIPVSEQLPPDREVVIVGQAVEDDGVHIFAGWLKPGHDGTRRWWSYKPGSCLSMMGELRAIDWWLPLPNEHPQENVVNGGYPA